MSATPDPFPIFGPRPQTGADKKKGRQAEARRPGDFMMLTTNTADRIPQSIGQTVTILDPQKRVDREREIVAAQAWLEGKLALGRREMFSETVTITPIMAALILQRNPDNRRLSKRLLQDLRADIENGHWVCNGETIILSTDGLLNDGQHRLTACRDSGVSIRTTVVFGVPRSARLTTDQGKARTVGDYLSMGGHGDDAIIAAAVARLLWQYERYGAILVRNIGNAKGEKFRQPTKTEVQGVALDHGMDINFSLMRVRKGAKAFGGQSLIAFCHLIFARIDQSAANVFIDRLLDGTGLSQSNPIHTLRERLLSDPKMRTVDRYEAIVRAWNAMRKERTLDKIQIMGRAPKVEA